MLKHKIKELRKERGLTLEELAKRIGTSKQNVHRYESGVVTNIPHERIEALAEALGVMPSELMGWESRENSSFYNNIDAIKPIRTKKIPILGKIACGEPIYAEEEYEGFTSADADLDADFCLRACGDSMIGARIHDGDIVFIRAQDSVDNGQIAAVIINDEATLKRVYYFPEESKLVLSPENPSFAPLVYVGEELNSIKIIGKAVAFHSRVF